MLVLLTTGYYNERHICINISIIFNVARHRCNWKGGGDKIDHGYGELYEGAKRGKFGLNTP